MDVVSTLHNHTCLSDGQDTPERMIRAAIAAGLANFGISDHSHTPRDLSYCLRDTEGYVSALRSLQRRYAGQILLYVGIEQDLWGPVDRSRFDYVIGSVHYYPSAQGVYPVDGSAGETARALRELFSGDPMAMTRAYYGQVVENVRRYRPDVVGHFDLLVKYNETGRFFDEADPRWQAVALEALDACLPYDPVFEINTGAMARGVRSVPYPAPFLLRRIRQKGGRVTVSADCHDASKLLYGFSEAFSLLRACGFSHWWAYVDGAFREQPLPV